MDQPNKEEAIFRRPADHQLEPFDNLPSFQRLGKENIKKPSNLMT